MRIISAKPNMRYSTHNYLGVYLRMTSTLTQSPAGHRRRSDDIIIESIISEPKLNAKIINISSKQIVLFSYAQTGGIKEKITKCSIS